ncbi:MAG: hypothetical protein ACOX7C_08120 [Brevefilum sp.]|jgi:hypothetical protein|nr:hypothetical protein [Bacteroidales bacterium]
MNLKELIFDLIGVVVTSENIAEIRLDPRAFVQTEEQAQDLEELLFLLEKSEESEDAV